MKLVFMSDQVQEPILARMAKATGVEFQVKHVEVEQKKWTVDLELSGDEAALVRARAYLEEQGVRIIKEG